jgi:hypothetical protein
MTHVPVSQGTDIAMLIVQNSRAACPEENPQSPLPFSLGCAVSILGVDHAGRIKDH